MLAEKSIRPLIVDASTGKYPLKQSVTDWILQIRTEKHPLFHISHAYARKYGISSIQRCNLAAI